MLGASAVVEGSFWVVEGADRRPQSRAFTPCRDDNRASFVPERATLPPNLILSLSLFSILLFLSPPHVFSFFLSLFCSRSVSIYLSRSLLSVYLNGEKIKRSLFVYASNAKGSM